MNKKLLTKFVIKDKKTKAELARAHGMILLLVIALMSILVISSIDGIVLDSILSFVSVVLLAIVGIISLSVLVALTKKK